MGLKEFFCKLFGCETLCPDCPDCPETPDPVRPIDLLPTTLRDFNGPVGETCAGAIGVQAIYSDDGSPAAGVELIVSVAKGPARLPDGADTLRVKTDAQGHIRVDAVMVSQGWSLYEVAREGAPARSVFFGSCTNEMTKSVYLYAQPCQPAAAGSIEVEMSALDFDGNPVTGAKLTIEAHCTAVFDVPLTGKVRELGHGRYQGSIPNTKAGQISLIGQDLNSRAIGRSNINVLPGPPDHIAILGDTDPRSAEPYDQVDLRVQLQDAQDNPLPPAGLQAQTESGQELIATLDGPSAIFRVTAVGYQYLPVTISHPESKLSESLTLHFAATWLRDPGLVLVESTFATSLYVLPRPDTSTDHGTVEIKFNPQLADFKDFVPATGQFDYQYQHSVTNSTLTLQFQSEQSYAANDYPQGMYLGDVVWDCLGDGETCFALTGRMSPTTDPWDLCVQQKRDRDDCICINIISPAGNAAAATAGTTAANQVASVISSAANVARCCPVLRVELHYCTIPQATINGIIGADGVINTQAELDAMTSDSNCVRANCINMRMIPTAVPTGGGGTIQGQSTVGPPGNIVLDPGAVGTVANVGAHEIGHSLGLNHASAGGAANNLLHSPQPHGDQLTAGQCQTIFGNIGSYAC